MKEITSGSNAVYKSIRRLARSSGARHKEGRIVLDGPHLVETYLERFGAAGVELIVKRSAARRPEIRTLLAKRTASAIMSDSLFDRAAPVQSPMGILGLAPLPRLSRPSAGQGFQVLLDSVQDPGNVGAILRCAAAAGAQMVHLSHDCADPWSPKCLRGGMGAQFVLPLLQYKDLGSEASSLSSRLIACTATAALSVFDVDLTGDIAFIIGGEGHGVSKGLLAHAHHQARIPMARGIESLNAAAAASVCFYEWFRRQTRIPSI